MHTHSCRIVYIVYTIIIGFLQVEHDMGPHEYVNSKDDYTIENLQS